MPIKQTPLVSAKSLYFSVFGVCASLLLLVVLIRANYSLYERNGIARENKNTLEREFTELEHRKNQLSASLKAIETKKGQEIALRKQFDMGRPGEELLIVVEQTPEKTLPIVEEDMWTVIKKYIPFLQ
jgi:hypothetical protein